MRALVGLPALAGLVGTAVAQNAAAMPESLYAKAGGYDVIRPAGGPANGLGCRMLRSTLEASDGNAEKAVIVAPKTGGVAFSVAYERWSWKAGQPPTLRYRIGDQNPLQEIVPVGAIVADGLAIGALFPVALVPRLQAATRVVVEANGSAVTFHLAGIRPAYDAVLRCNRNEPPAPPGPVAGTASPAAAPSATAPATIQALPPVAQASPPVQGSPPGQAAPPGQAPLPTEARLAAYMLGRGLKSVFERCDLPTTSRERATLDAKLAALRPEMTRAETAIQLAIDKQAGVPCGGDDPSLRQALEMYVRTTPEEFAAEWDGKRSGVGARVARQILAALKPAGPPRARVATFLYGLVLQDLIAHCDIATTARQRAGLKAKLDGFRAEMPAQEAELQKQKGAFTTCPPAGEVSDFQTVMPLFLERSPEEFSAEMDRRQAGRTAALPAPPNAEPGCRLGSFPQDEAQAEKAFTERFRRDLPAFVIEKAASNEHEATFVFAPLTEKDAGPRGFVVLDRVAGRFGRVLIAAPVARSDWRQAMTLVASHVINVYDATQAVGAVGRTVAPHVKERVHSVPDRIPFGSVYLQVTQLKDGNQALVVDRWNGADCTRDTMK
ncbi:hypothetical protein [Methylobacterium terricola]|uniref:hypothetical protein n=1 Tax=Methylobacterium terricola TaxID=2583531 RepID=UPI0014863EB9|nr:hypothetical protein [Methylobacterium terricola]